MVKEKKTFCLTLKEEDLVKIKLAAENSRRSMANFLVNAALEKINLEEQQTKE